MRSGMGELMASVDGLFAVPDRRSEPTRVEVIQAGVITPAIKAAARMGATSHSWEWIDHLRRWLAFSRVDLRRWFRTAGSLVRRLGAWAPEAVRRAQARGLGVRLGAPAILLALLAGAALLGWAVGSRPSPAERAPSLGSGVAAELRRGDRVLRRPGLRLHYRSAEDLLSITRTTPEVTR